MDMTKIVWAVVVVVILGGGWLFTTGGMNKAYEQATKNLVGNNPEQDVIDEAVLSKYGGYNLSLFRYEQAKKFYSTSINRYGPTGKNYWWNLQQLALCEENMENPQASVTILYNLWLEDGDAYDERVSNRDQLALRITKLVELNELRISDYPTDERTLRRLQRRR
jgi:hypothetical protein